VGKQWRNIVDVSWGRMRDWRGRRGSAKNIWNMYVSNRQTAKRSNQRSCVPRNPTISHWSSSMGIDWFPSFIWYYNSTPRCFSRSSSPGSCKIVPNWAPRLVIVTFTKTLPHLGFQSARFDHVGRNPANQLRLVVYLPVSRRFCTSKRWLALGILNHQTVCTNFQQNFRRSLV